MADMKFKENLGVDPVTLSRGYTKLEGDPPNSGESITDPRHIAEKRRMEKMMVENGWPDMEAEEDGAGGFLDREKPTPYDRPNRSVEEDQG